jgi:hypothetical protein
MKIPWEHFSHGKTQTQGFYRKINGLRFHNLAVKERSEPLSTSSTYHNPLSVHAVAVWPVYALFEG